MARAKPHTQTEIDARKELATDKLWFDFSHGLRVLKIKKRQDRATCEDWLNQSYVNYLLASCADAQETPARKRAALLAARSRILEQDAPWDLPPSVENAVRARMGHGTSLRDAVDAEVECLGRAAIRGQRPDHAFRNLIMSLLAAAEHWDPSLPQLIEVPPWDPRQALDKHRNPDPPPPLAEGVHPHLTQRHKEFLVAVLEHDLPLPGGRAYIDFEDNPSRSRARLWGRAVNKVRKRRKTPDPKK
jgi:hypothetical protein